MSVPRVLLIGYGNPGRQDDGLGPALATRLEAAGLPGLTVDADYQLTVEMAHAAAGQDVVVFADADVGGAEPYYFRRVAADLPPVGYTSHHVEPEEVVALARDLFGWRGAAYVLGIRGYAFNEFGEGLSEPAQANLDQAAAFLAATIREMSFAMAARREDLTVGR